MYFLFFSFSSTFLLFPPSPLCIPALFPPSPSLHIHSLLSPLCVSSVPSVRLFCPLSVSSASPLLLSHSTLFIPVSLLLLHPSCKNTRRSVGYFIVKISKWPFLFGKLLFFSLADIVYNIFCVLLPSNMQWLHML